MFSCGSIYCPVIVYIYMNDIPASFLNCEESLQAITDTVNKIEKQLMQERMHIKVL